MANDTDGLVLALAIDGLTLGDDQLRAVGSSLLALVRYHEHKMKPQVAVYNVAKLLAKSVDVGLAFVPLIAERFPEMSGGELQNHLLQLDNNDLIELRPDSRSERQMTDLELEVCPRGLDNSVLSWVRIRNEDD
jgi:hypothetical protein